MKRGAPRPEAEAVQRRAEPATQNPQETELFDEPRQTRHAELETPEEDIRGAGMAFEERVVRVIHGEDAPLGVSGTPNASALYEEAPPHATSDQGADADWAFVRGSLGTVEAPIVSTRHDERAVFIDGEPQHTLDFGLVDTNNP